MQKLCYLDAILATRFFSEFPRQIVKIPEIKRVSFSCVRNIATPPPPSFPVFLAMGRSKSALPDLDKVITMKPDFVSARLQRGNIHLKQGTFEDARRDFEGVLDISPDNEEALAKLEEVQPLEQALSDAETLLRCAALR